MRREAWLVLESGERCDCAVSDISDRGARLTFTTWTSFPKASFYYWRKTARRECRVIWRKPRQLGVKFDTWLDARIRATQKKPGVGADAASQVVEPAETDV